MKLNRLLSSFFYITFLLILYSLAACSSSSSGGSGSISISSPDEGAQVSGVIMVEGSCSVIDDLTVVIDDDSYTKQVVNCTSGNWIAEFDTSYFQDGDHALLAYNGNINDSVQITTANGNQSGFIVTVPVSLATGIYDEIDQLTPLYVYAKKIATGLVSGQQFTLGTFPGEFEIPNLLNGVYEIGAFLDRNNNRIMDEGWDYAGTAVALLEVSNGDISSGDVELDIYIIDDGTDYEAGIFNPGDVSGTISISSPVSNETVIGVLEAAGGASGSIENVQVTIDNNLLSAQIVPVSLSKWSASFDTTRLQDGLHTLIARANDEIEAIVFFTTDNSNTQGYAVTVSVELT
ncbi:MAG: hypothetical protein KAU21_17145, partial [Gammaproteobacteria bacterium]|nr:hypothetical protein [Gammaproteobacteria bacterium]